MKKQSTRTLKLNNSISMLTCYDYQTAKLLNETELDCILVGDSLGNVVLGFDSTIPVKPSHMILFGKAVRKGAPKKFLILDLPFGSYPTFEQGIESAINIFQATEADAVKLEGASEIELKIVKRLTEIGIPVVGHIGLQPQSYKTQGGYYIQGKNEESSQRLINEAKKLEQAGAFMVVLECIIPEVASLITKSIGIPTIGIGSGQEVTGQVLVINDLLKDSYSNPPGFCEPITDIYQKKKDSIEQYLSNFSGNVQ